VGETDQTGAERRGQPGDVEPYAWAALRDATFLRCPETRTVKRWHVDRGSGIAACSSPTGWSSRCNPMLDTDMRMPAGEVARRHRCQRPGCRVRWPT
jgi:hypothetical protein